MRVRDKDCFTWGSTVWDSFDCSRIELHVLDEDSLDPSTCIVGKASDTNFYNLTTSNFKDSAVYVACRGFFW